MNKNQDQNFSHMGNKQQSKEYVFLGYQPTKNSSGQSEPKPPPGYQPDKNSSGQSQPNPPSKKP